MGAFHDMANGVGNPVKPYERPVFTVSKRRSSGTVFIKPQVRRAAFQQILGIPSADPENIGGIYRDANNFLKVSIG